MTARATRITLCGALAVELDGRRVEQDLPGRQGRLLVAYLAAQRQRSIGRDELVDALWPSKPPADPDETFSALLSKVRRVLGKGVIEGRRELTLVLPTGASIDVEEAERAAEEADAALAGSRWDVAWEEASAALRVASGGFLTGYDARWVEDRRRAIEDLRLHALECAAAAGAALGGAELAAAERAARTLIEAAPLRESGYRFLMAALAARGNVAEALAVYEDLRVLLRDELGAVPGAAVKALHERLLRDGAVGPVGAQVIDPLATPADGESPSEPTVDRPREERKVVTVLVADAVPDEDPERTEAWLRLLRAAATREAETSGAMLDGATGGGVVVTFGIPAQEDHAERAVEFAHALAAELEGKAPVRIAVETGEVVVGGSGPTGPPVLAAARMLQDAPAGAVLVAGRTQLAARARGRRIRLSPFVGRDPELGSLRSVFERACEARSPQLVTIVGDAGVGKSRLVAELHRWLASEATQVRQLVGRCSSYGRAVTYRALGEVLVSIRARPEADRPSAITRLASREILDLTLGIDAAGDLHPLAAVEQLRRAWVELIAGLVQEHPTLLVIEDVHWAQADLLDLLEQLVSETGGPLMLACTARPELLGARPSWGRRRDATTLWLEPLDPGEAAQLVVEVPTYLRDAVLERAEGNPFFLEELLARIGEGGEVDVTAIPDSIQAVLAARIDQLPSHEKEALQAASVIGRSFWREAVDVLVGGAAPNFRILEERDFVRPRGRSSLERTRELTFKHALTCEVAYGSLPRARRARLHGGFARWLEGLTGGRDEYAALLAHHYYEAVRVEAADIAWEGAEPELVELRARAVSWLRRAAELAVARYEIDESLALLGRALELDSDDGDRCAVYRTIARANALKFDGEAFWTAMETAADLAPDDLTRAEIVSQLAVQAFVRAGMWTKTPAIEKIGEWVARGLELSQPGTPSRARALIAKASLDLDDTEAAAQAAVIAEQIDDPELCVHAWDACANVAMVAADYESAWRWRTRRLELLDRVSDPDLRTIIGETPYAACVATGRFDQARKIARLHDQLTKPLTPHHRLHGAAILVEVEELLGGWDSIRAQETRVGNAVAANASTPCVRNARSLLVCALAAACLGDDERAQELERAADELGLLGRQVLDAPRLRLALLRGDRQRAEQLLAGLLGDRGWYARGHGTSLATLTTQIDALAILGHRDRVEAEAPRLLQTGTYIEPFALRALGIARDDQALIRQAIDRFDRLDLTWQATQTRALAAR